MAAAVKTLRARMLFHLNTVHCTVNILVHTVQYLLFTVQYLLFTVQYLLFTVQCTIVQMAKGSKHLFQKSASYVGDMPRFLTQLQYDPLSGPDKHYPNNNQNLRIKTGPVTGSTYTNCDRQGFMQGFRLFLGQCE